MFLALVLAQAIFPCSSGRVEVFPVAPPLVIPHGFPADADLLPLAPYGSRGFTVRIPLALARPPVTVEAPLPWYYFPVVPDRRESHVEQLVIGPDNSVTLSLTSVRDR